MAFTQICGYWSFYLIVGLLDCAIALNDESGAVTPPPPIPSNSSSSLPPAIPTEWLEMDILGFHLWMIIGFVLLGVMAIVIILCCAFDCRIPRTKQEIEASAEKKLNKQARAAVSHGNQRNGNDNGRNHDNRRNNGNGNGRNDDNGRSYSKGRNQGNISNQRGRSGDSDSAAKRATQETEVTNPSPSYVTRGEFQLHDRPYGKRLQYTPEHGLSASQGSGSFRPDTENTLMTLSSLPSQANSAV